MFENLIWSFHSDYELLFDWLFDILSAFLHSDWPLRYVLTYATEFTNNEAGNSNYVLTLIVNGVLSLLNGLYEAV